MNWFRKLLSGRKAAGSASTLASPSATHSASPINAMGHVLMSMSRDQVLRKDTAAIQAYIESACLPQIRSGGHPQGCSSIILTVSGYDRDRRELWDIPEVVEWFRSLHRAHPYAPCFLSTRSAQLYFGILQKVALQLVPMAKYQVYAKAAGLPPQTEYVEVVALMWDTFAQANAFFEAALGPDLPRCQATIDQLTQKVSQAVANLIDGKWEGV